ncbi:MAG: conjugal transfer protein MobC [Puia sp.]
MASGTGENAVGLEKVLEFTRMGSIVLLLLHFYYFCYDAFADWGFTNPITNRFLWNIARTGLFERNHAKLLSLGLLIVSLIGGQGRKDGKTRRRSIVWLLGAGLVTYFSAGLCLDIDASEQSLCITYISLTTLGYLLVLAGGSRLSRLIRIELGLDVFNELNETFPQEERLLTNDYSVNLPALYSLKGKVRRSWINIINPFRGLLVIGSPGSGKSYFVIQRLIKQHIAKGFTMLVYDFKYPDLSGIAFNALQRDATSFLVAPIFCRINLDDPSQSDRCNPLDPASMIDITDAIESSRSILLGLNREWITKQGDFFVESPINFVTAVIWFLRKYMNGKFCTLPHVIELMQVDYENLFPVLKTEPEIEVMINPFISAYQNDAMEQLEGQIASAKIGMARLSSPQLYWVLSGNDFTLDINNPESPKVLCLANNPQKQQTFGPVLSLYVNRLVKMVNQKNKHKCSLVFDEFPTIFLNGIDNLIATARSNKVAACLGMQDFSQLKKDYGSDQASVIMNITGNIISGQVMGETAKVLADRFGKISQLKNSMTINRTDTSVSRSTQMDFAIPQSKIASLSSGEFVGMVADDPNQKIKLKCFHCEIDLGHGSMKEKRGRSHQMPQGKAIDPGKITDNYFRIKADISELIDAEIQRLSMKAPR